MELLKKYGIIIKDDGLINTALTHTSYSNEHHTESYERLEYLGDAVLELVASDYLFKFSEYEEGAMSRLRSLYVCEKALAEYAKDINLSSYIRLGNGLKSANDTVVADVFEAVIAVIYLEQGINEVRKLFNKLIVPYITSNVDFLMDYKSMFQESIQTGRKVIIYKTLNEEGKENQKVFTSAVYVDDIEYGRGSGKNKKEAEQNAAKDAMNKKV
ncbi:MAG: ribonuclease III [Bacilli bacterium]